MQLLDFQPHLDSQLGVKVRQWLIEQEQLRIAYERPTHGYPLALTARELAGASIEKLFDLKLPGHVLQLAGAGCTVHPAHFHAERDVPGHGHGRIQSVGLEHHRNVAVLGADMGHVTSADMYRPAGNRLQPGYAVQQGGLAAAGRAYQNQKSSRLRRNVDVLQDFRRAIALVEISYLQHRFHQITPSRSPRSARG